MREDDGDGIGYSVGLFRVSAGPLGEEEAAEVLARGGDIYAELRLNGKNGKWVAAVKISTGSGGGGALWEVLRGARGSAGGAAERALMGCVDALLARALAGASERYSMLAEPEGE